MNQLSRYNIWYKPKGLSDSYMKMKSVEGTATSTEIQELCRGFFRISKNYLNADDHVFFLVLE